MHDEGALSVGITHVTCFFFSACRYAVSLLYSQRSTAFTNVRVFLAALAPYFAVLPKLEPDDYQVTNR